MVRLLLAAAAAFLFVVSTASAHHELAEHVWGPVDCGTIDIAYVDLDGPYGLAYWDRCRIEIDEGIKSPVWRCTVMLHEWGHLASPPYYPMDPTPHSDNIRSVMYPMIVEWDHRCVERVKNQ